jgi:N-acyl-D-amino-acid deacylase
MEPDKVGKKNMANLDLILRKGLVVDGSGNTPYPGEIGIRGNRIEVIAGKIEGTSAREIDCAGMVVSPGFINLHSWAAQDLLSDGRAISDVLQGVTLEVFGESWSEGPLSPEMKEYIKGIYGIPEIPWTTLSEFLTFLEKYVGVSVNVGSYVGVDNLRYHTVGMASRAASPDELGQMVEMLETEMRAGAMGVGSALIYVPGMYFQTHELRALAQAAFRHNGAYISHIRSEGNRFDEALEEFLTICEGGKGIFYHFKLQGEKNWHKLEAGLHRIEQARSCGTQVGACVYPYIAGMTSLSNVLPPWAREGGKAQILQTIANAGNRARLVTEMALDQDEWENLYMLAGGARGTRIVDLKSEAFARFNGALLSEIAAQLGESPEDTILQVIQAEKGDPSAIFFNGSEENLQKILTQPWVCLGSDIGSFPIENNKITHPRAFGTFARFLGHYCRDLGLLSLAEGIRRITSLPASLLGIDGQRGWLRPGYAADIAIFDVNSIQDRATYEQPLQYATGVQYVLVNGQVVVENGTHTGAKPGMFVHGPGYQGNLATPDPR